MFKGQSKQALAEDEVLLREIKLALEDAGRRFRRFITRRETAQRKAKRAGILAMYADQFAESLVSIANSPTSLSMMKELSRRVSLNEPQEEEETQDGSSNLG
jgi:DNA topoisomerase VI subunit B